MTPLQVSCFQSSIQLQSNSELLATPFCVCPEGPMVQCPWKFPDYWHARRFPHPAVVSRSIRSNAKQVREYAEKSAALRDAKAELAAAISSSEELEAQVQSLWQDMSTQRTIVDECGLLPPCCPTSSYICINLLCGSFLWALNLKQSIS